MAKVYKLLIECAEFPIGTEAREGTNHNIDTPLPYHLFVNDEKVYYGIASRAQIENRPEVWELQEEKLDLRSLEAEKMREEARSKRWEFVPSTDENFSAGYFSWDFIQNNTIKLRWKKDVVDICKWNLGCVKRTDEEALAWGEKYARYFLTE